jgi:hypothetical protein
LLWVGAKGIVWAIAWIGRPIEVIACSEQVHVGKFHEACVAVATAAEASVNSGGVADALAMD